MPKKPGTRQLNRYALWRKGLKMSNTLTCVYCGMTYPEGTPPHGSKVLTDHIKVCEKHPMYKLRKALADMVGASSKEELEQMEFALRAMPGIEQDKIVALNAIHALLETA
jgi:formate-dependent nitrite reductase cytochrome c552 subunit